MYVPLERINSGGPSSGCIGERFHCRVVQVVGGLEERFHCRVVPVVGGLERGSTVEWSK